MYYILGDTGRSFVVGFGVNPPKYPHHSASSCPDQPETCDWDDFNSPNPNPQTLNGALVGGPDSNDNYNDARNDYVSNEVALDYNAGFQSVIAYLCKKYFSGTGSTSVTTSVYVTSTQTTESPDTSEPPEVDQSTYPNCGGSEGSNSSGGSEGTGSTETTSGGVHAH